MATLYMRPCHDPLSERVRTRPLTPALVPRTLSVGTDAKPRNHSRESRPYISKLLNEAYDCSRLGTAFIAERKYIPCAVQNGPQCTF